MKPLRPIAWLFSILLLAAPLLAAAAGALGPEALRARQAALQPQLANNSFGGPLFLESKDASRNFEGDVYAVIEHPFDRVSGALADPGQWCDILILHLNNKYCRTADKKGTMHVLLRVGKKQPQAIEEASLLDFTWHAPVARPDYLAVQMEAADGPYDTGDYRIFAEAVPLDGGRSFLHMGYAFSYGGASQFAMKMYLGTIARDKVGFTRAAPGEEGEGGFVGGMRGVAERNTMRYYLAIDAYLDSLAAPSDQRLEHRLAGWFDATEKYPRQLHEVDRNAYLKMKRDEVQRQASAR